MNKPKMQGTAFESWCVRAMQMMGLDAKRIAEGGSKDLGDVEINAGNRTWFMECKSTQTLNVTRVLGKARTKSGSPRFTVLAWKRLTKLKEGQKKRRPDGEPIVVSMGWDTFEILLDAYDEAMTAGIIQRSGPAT